MNMEIWIKMIFQNCVVGVSTEWTKLIIRWDHHGPDFIAMDGIVV